MKQTVTVYGVGGYDPALPNDNVVEQYEVDVPDPIPTAEETRIAELEATVNALIDALAGTDPA